MPCYIGDMGYGGSIMGIYSISGSWLSHPSEKYEFVSWDDEIPNNNGKIIQMFQTTNHIYTVSFVKKCRFAQKFEPYK